MDDIPPPDVSEEPYYCAGGCGSVVGMTVRINGRMVGLRLAMATPTERAHLVRGLSSICECCGSEIHFSLADKALAQVIVDLREMKAAGLW